MKRVSQEIASWERTDGCPENAADEFDYEHMRTLRELYCKTHMVNKYVIPLKDGTLSGYFAT